jgi:hypothetical protein
MPNTEGLKLLVRKQPLTKDDWLKLIEARCALISPHLSSFTLSKLGDLECLRTELNFKHPLLDDLSHPTGDRWFSLDTQGIFCCPRSGIQRIPNSGYQAQPGGVSCPDGVMYLWGFTRDASWVLVKVRFKGEAGYKCRGYERAKEVNVEFTNLEKIITETKSTPEEIWKELGKAVKGWTKRRQQLYDKALELERVITTEELALSLCQKER